MMVTELHCTCVCVCALAFVRVVVPIHETCVQQKGDTCPAIGTARRWTVAQDTLITPAGELGATSASSGYQY
jgi:hypothetical protein